MSAANLELSMFLCWSLSLVFVVALVRFWPRVRSYPFSFLYSNFFGPMLITALKEPKRKLFDDLGNLKSHDWQLRNEGLIRILEIGCGPGLNFEYYPKNCRVVCYDINPYFRKYLFQNHELFPNVNLERFVVSGGEKLVGTPDESVDVVVTTLVNCSVNDIDQVFREIKRVLAPGGRYYFLDHVGAAKGSLAYRVQKLLNPVTKVLFGCDIQRDGEKALRKVGFSNIELHRFTPPLPIVAKPVVKDFLMGVATK